jgi:hypothetical protein
MNSEEELFGFFFEHTMAGFLWSSEKYVFSAQGYSRLSTGHLVQSTSDGRSSL